MPSKDIFKELFDEGSITKLEIFEKYFEEWLPTFIMSKYGRPIQVFYFFVGIGYDKNNVPGSSIRMLEVINKHNENLIKKSIRVFVVMLQMGLEVKSH